MRVENRKRLDLVSRVPRVERVTRPADNDRSYGQWARSAAGTYWEPPYLGSSDVVARANLRALREEYPEAEGSWLVIVHGGYGTRVAMVSLSRAPLDALEWLLGLAEYPVLSDDVLCQVEQEEASEAWDSWAASDYRAALAEEIGCDREVIEAIDDATLYDLFRAGCDEANVYWEHNCVGPYIDLARVAKHTPTDQIPDSARLLAWSAIVERDDRGDVCITVTDLGDESEAWGYGSISALRDWILGSDAIPTAAEPALLAAIEQSDTMILHIDGSSLV